MQNIRTGHALRDGFVSEMDPDAINRGDGVALASDDAVQFCFYFSSFFVFLSLFYPQSYEKSLLQALYGYIRAGRLDDAVEVCRRAHQPWRAASIRGSLLFQWKAICECPSPFASLLFFSWRFIFLQQQSGNRKKTTKTSMATSWNHPLETRIVNSGSQLVYKLR